MSARLDELRRQRALLQEHLTWLEREIAAAAQKPSSPVTTRAHAPVPRAATATTAGIVPAVTRSGPSRIAPTVAAPVTEAAAEEILKEYRVKPELVKQDVRKGCFLYFAAACALFALGIVGLYFSLRTD